MENAVLAHDVATTGRGWKPMQLVETTSPSTTHGERLRVAHSETTLPRGLEPGEQVVVRTTDGEYHSATVDGLDFEPEDTRYDLAIGARLPVELAAERLSGVPLDGDSAGVQEIVELLGRLGGPTTP